MNRKLTPKSIYLITLATLLQVNITLGQNVYFRKFDKEYKPGLGALKEEDGKFGIYEKADKNWLIQPEYDSIGRGSFGNMAFNDGLITLFGDIETVNGKYRFSILAAGIEHYTSISCGDGTHTVYKRNGQYYFEDYPHIFFDSILRGDLAYSPITGSVIGVIKDGSFGLYGTNSHSFTELNEVQRLEQIPPYDNYAHRQYFLATTSTGKKGLVALPDGIHSNFVYDTIFHYEPFSRFYACNLRSGLCDEIIETSLGETIRRGEGEYSRRYQDRPIDSVYAEIRRHKEAQLVTLEEFQSITFFNSFGNVGARAGTKELIKPVTHAIYVELSPGSTIVIRPLGRDSLKIVWEEFQENYLREAILDRRIFDQAQEEGSLKHMHFDFGAKARASALNCELDISMVRNPWGLTDTMLISLSPVKWKCPLCNGHGKYIAGYHQEQEEVSYERQVVIGQETREYKSYMEHYTSDGRMYYPVYSVTYDVYGTVTETRIDTHTYTDWEVCPYIDMKEFERNKKSPYSQQYTHLFMLIWDNMFKQYFAYPVR